MTLRRNLVWLASFPKSGNTWLRFLLANYLLDREEPLPLEEIGRYSVSDSSVSAFSKVAGRPAAGLSEAEVFALRQKVQRRYAEAPVDLVFVKTHALAGEIDGRPMIDPAVTRASLQVVRNPLDVAVSFASHYGISLEQAVESLCRDNLVLRGKNNLPTLVGSWGANCASWLEAAEALSVLTLRYEDLEADTAGELSRALRHLGVEPEARRLEKAVAFAAFESLSGQERSKGFSEASSSGGRFFRSGRSGEGARRMDRSLIERLWAKHEAVIRRLGYQAAFEPAAASPCGAGGGYG